MIVGTGGTTGRPKGVMLTNANLETMTALTLIGYPFEGRPVYLALAPLTHAAGVLCFPILASGGEVVIMRAPDVGGFLALVERHRVTHTFLPPTLIYMVLAAPALDTTDLSSLQCFWYGAAPMSATRLEEALVRIGPVMAQLFGQTEAPMMVSTMAPADHFEADGSVATRRLSSAGRPSPLVTVAIMDPDGALLPTGQRGEIVVRSSLVMAGYYKDPQATADVGRHGWHHTGDIGYLDEDRFLYIVDRAKDMIITGGFNVYSTEVEQALSAHPDVQDCAVVGRPDDKWGERVVAVVQPHPGTAPDPADLMAFVKERIGSREDPQGDPRLARPPPLQGRQGPQDRHQGRARPLTASLSQRMTTTRSPPSTGCTEVSARRSTVPATGVVMEASIFIASMVATVSPAATSWPFSTITVTVPWNGAATWPGSPGSAFSAAATAADTVRSRTLTGRIWPLMVHITVRKPRSSGSLTASRPRSRVCPSASRTVCSAPCRRP